MPNKTRTSELLVLTLKSLIPVAMLVYGIVAISYGQGMLQEEQKITLKPILIMFTGIVSVIATTVPILPCSHHNLVCKPVEQFEKEFEEQ